MAGAAAANFRGAIGDISWEMALPRMRIEMSDHDGFLRAIVDSPEDDLPRLVFADWLEERGEGDRAEFIRAQCALAHCEEGDGRDRLEAIAHRLLRGGRRAWAPAVVREKAAAWEFERGFVSAIKIKSEAFLEAGEGLRAAAPIRRVDLIGLGESEFEEFAWLAEAGVLAGLDSLDLSGMHPFARWEIERRRAEPFIMALAGAGIGAFGAGEAVASTMLQTWKRRGVPLPGLAVGRREIAWSTLILAISWMEDRHCLRWARTRSVTPGRFFGTALGARLNGLEGLYLEETPASDPWRPSLGAADDLPGGLPARTLRELALRNCRLRPGDLRNLLATPRLAGLVRLELLDRYGLADWSELFDGEPHPALRSLAIRREGAARGLMNPSWPGWDRFPGLGHLAIEDASPDFDAGDAFLRSLAGPELGGRLRKLSLRGMRPTAVGIDALASAGVLERLHVLELRGGQLRDELAERLAAIGPWPALALLDLRQSPFSKGARGKLREAFGPLVELGPGIGPGHP